jgi:hypothetical protein
MTTTFIGTTFPPSSDWSVDEKQLINDIQNQIDQLFPVTQNLFINSTWFGPQFDNGQWNKYKKIIAEHTFDNIFMLAAADPVFLNSDQIDNIQKETGAEMYLLGHFESKYYFNFHSLVLPKYFVSYDKHQLLMQEPKWIYVNYNRKPRDHRTKLVDQLINKDLIKHGVVTLGKNNKTFSNEVGPATHLTLDESIQEAVGNWGMSMDHGIPHDIHSLGRLEIWQKHFLNVVGETESYPWDNMFISEKTWKPIIGLRPFVINGQTTIYRYLRNNGFKTFEKYFNGIEIENIPEYEVQNSIVSVIEYFSKLSETDIKSLYQDMLPDLIHNRNRFFEFSKEQWTKVNNLFKN